MSTPYATHLHGIESWSTDQIEYSHEDLVKVSASLTAIAKTNRSVASDLGLEGSTAGAACACFDSLATHLFDHAKKIDQIVKVSTDVMNAGIDARNTSTDIQTKLKGINTTLDVGGGVNGNITSPGAAAAAAQAQAQRDAAYAEIEKQAKQALHTLDAKALAGISQLPFQDEIHQAAAGPDSPEAKPRMVTTTSPEQTSPATHTTAGGAQKSATAWTVTPDRSIDSPGSQPDVFLQANHHATSRPSSTSSVLTASTPGSLPNSPVSARSILHSPVVHNALATAAAVGGATTIAGYKAYQAARSTQTVQAKPSSSSAGRSGAAIRTTPTRTGSIVRGATTASRTPIATTGRGTARGGATGIARPTTSTPRPNGILRGTTTAIRARTPTTTARPSIVRGATTAIRTPTNQTEKTGQTSGTRSATSTPRGSTSRTTGTGRSTSSTSRTTGTSSGRGSMSRTTGSTTARGTTGRAATSNSARISSKLSATGRERPADTGRNITSARSATTTTRAASSSSGLTRSSQTSGSSTSRALSSLTGRPDKNKRRDTNHPIDHTPVSPYKEDKTITFLEAGQPRTPTNRTADTPQ